MISLQEIAKYYPVNLFPLKEMMLKEYLQYKILEILFDSDYASRLCFMGGTCLRIVHQNMRFSEDLDFDNFGLQEREFQSITGLIRNQLIKQGYEVQIEEKYRGAWHCNIRFPGILYQENLSGHKDQKILIQIDTEPHYYDYVPDLVYLNKFDVFTSVFSSPLPLLLSQKFYAILNRKRTMGRDFYDVVFLMGKNIQPDYLYLEKKTGISNFIDLKSAINQKIEPLNMKEVAKDVEPFLFDLDEIKRVNLFKEYWNQLQAVSDKIE